jgi:ABC-2 type transport system ATP-binding protein
MCGVQGRVQIDLQQLGKTYDGHAWAVRGMSLSVGPGKIFGLIGPNGAGKSTALRMIATVTAPTEGRLLLDGEDVAADPLRARRRIGFLGDGNPLYKHMTPAEYLRFFGQCFRLPAAEIERAIEDTLDTFHLRSKRDTPTGALSKGMRQRLLIARCLLHRPSLLILDEPADGLDPRGRSELRQCLLRVRERGVTILVSSHILRELDDLCDQVAILQQGRVVVNGPVDAIIREYDVSRFSYDIRVLAGVDRAREVLARHRALVESAGIDDGLPRLTVQVLGGEELMATILSDLVAAGVRVATVSRQRSRLEDVYDRISADQVN